MVDYKYMRYVHRKSYFWSSELAYCVGLIASDGSLSKDGRHIDFTSKDIELINTYRSILFPMAAVGHKKNGRGMLAFRVQVSDTGLYDFLLQVGLTPNKSKTIAALNVPEEWYADFLRGYFDGDGTTYNYIDKRWKSSFMYYIELASASQAFLLWMRSRNMARVGVGAGYLRPATVGTRVAALVYAKRDTNLLYDFMYYKSDLPCLQRKRTKLLNALLKMQIYSRL